ncbi:nitric oxide synthase oxygenase [Paenibacillus lemnae]|uniref:Nitric oxide synthase oxygenase n=1 Tax=Paenibacillus lemnae TaxID=1330551 RepID=A0A848M597_PAELE|nr:nitric oxide synthase oxygenase [Paenibacillus lemnae]NMO95410.1 nitric oxide synthase oxygenase [Paenibacillus lemnae]
MSVNLELKQSAERFILQCYTELDKTSDDIQHRIDEITAEIMDSGTYVHTYEELEHGAKMAWRNSNRCIGRLFWDKLRVTDARHAETAGQAARLLIQHVNKATNSGKIIPTITVFGPKHPQKEHLVIRNHQLIRYAGYEGRDGITGDPASLEFTSLCQSLGWSGTGGEYDILPLVIQQGDRRPAWFPIPEESILQISLAHPHIPDFESMQLQWYAVPIISDMNLEIGGITYPAAPFNGWYMGTEIGSRNLADSFRFNKLPVIADHLGLDRSRESSLWRDRALLELNTAVLYSFKQAGVSIVDHHTAAMQFRSFEDREYRSGRNVTGDWSWLIPPMSPAATHIFHSSYDNEMLSPAFRYKD